MAATTTIAIKHGKNIGNISSFNELDTIGKSLAEWPSDQALLKAMHGSLTENWHTGTEGFFRWINEKTSILSCKLIHLGNTHYQIVIEFDPQHPSSTEEKFQFTLDLAQHRINDEMLESAALAVCKCYGDKGNYIEGKAILEHAIKFIGKKSIPLESALYVINLKISGKSIYPHWENSLGKM